MSRGQKAVLVILCLLAGFLVAALVVVPRLLQIDLYRSAVIATIEEQTGRRVQIGHLEITLLPAVSIRVDHFAIANPAGFPEGNWLSVAHIIARLDLHALWNRQILISALHLNQPILNLVSDGQGRWNYQMPALGGSAAADPPQKAAHDGQLFSFARISKVVLKQGKLAVASPGGRAGPLPAEAHGISVSLENVDLAALAEPAGGGSNTARAAGQLKVASLHFGSIQASQVKSKLQILPGRARLDHLRFELYGGSGQGNITLDVLGATDRYDAQAELSNVDVGKLLDAFPPVRGSMTGRLQSRLTLSGESTRSSDPWIGMQGQGVVIIRKGRWPKLRLDKNLLELAHLAHLGAASGDISSFSSISAHWQLAHNVITTRGVRIVARGITVDGSGTINLAEPKRLHYRGIAEIAARHTPLTSVLASLSGATFQGGKLSLPFAVGGTLQKPLLQLNRACKSNGPVIPAGKTPNEARQ